MSAAHTPGPWVVGSDATQFGVARGNGMEPIGFVYAPSFPERSELGLRALADARLIAAAPDLLAALQDMLKHGDAGDRARAVLAIKKATGGQP